MRRHVSSSSPSQAVINVRTLVLRSPPLHSREWIQSTQNIK
jgi:hypothetical protein